jgi:hypothetical protein
MHDFAICTKPDPDLTRALKPGFLLPYLLEFDALTYGRWQYWLEAMERGSLPDRPIPPIDWLDAPNARTRKMVLTALNCIPRHGCWETMSGRTYFTYLMEWMLWGFGHPGYVEPPEPADCEGASMRLYQVVNINAWSLWPADYLGDLLAEHSYGKRQGFFPTPMAVSVMLASMLMGNGEQDLRRKSVCDPAVGTGRLLLAASNYSLRLAGIDIDRTLCLATLVNGYLLAPWLARPFPFLDTEPDAVSAEESNAWLQREASSAEAFPADRSEHTEALPANSRPPRARRRPAPDGQGSLFGS